MYYAHLSFQRMNVHTQTCILAFHEVTHSPYSPFPSVSLRVSPYSPFLPSFLPIWVPVLLSNSKELSTAQTKL